MTRRRLVVLILSLAGAAAACTGGEGSGGPGADEAVDAVEGFDPASPDSLDRLNTVIVEGGDVIAALEPLLADPDPVRRWAALYVTASLAASDEDAETLARALEDPDPANRVIAAGSLVGLGRSEAVPVLIEGLGADVMLPYTDPPRPIADLALRALEAYTGESFATPEEWEAWWADVGDAIRWDGDRYVVA